MRTILCYGDSNTWGFEPGTMARYPEGVRWTGVLKGELGEGYRVVEEGLNARTTLRDDPVEGAHKNGKPYLYPCLESHKPIDLVTLMLGTNDLKERFRASASDIAQGAGILADLILGSRFGPDGGAPKVLLMAPPPLGRLTDFAQTFEGGPAKSRKFSSHYRRYAERYGCEFLDASECVVSSDVDGIHLEAGEHRKLGEAVAARVLEILG